MPNQPADLHVEQVKATLNPEARQWTWAARNMRLRESLVIGSPRADAACPRGFMVEDINCIREAVEKANEVPSGCTRVLGNVPGSPDGQTTIVKLEWSWKDFHEPDEDFDMVLQVLWSRFLAGQTELVAVDGAEASVAADRAGAFVGGAGRPPVASAGTRRGAKRTADEDPVVPVTPTVRRPRHPKAAARFEKTVTAAAAMLVDEERRVSVVRAPYVVGEVKPFSAWPHGGIVGFAQFPFLLDPSFNEQGKMVSLCRKLLAFDVGCSYEVMFGPKRLARCTSVVGGANDTEPLLAAPGVAATAVHAGATAGVEGAASDADAAPSGTGPVGAKGAAGAESPVGTASVVESVGPTGAAGSASPVAAGGAGGAGGLWVLWVLRVRRGRREWGGRRGRLGGFARVARVAQRMRLQMPLHARWAASSLRRLRVGRVRLALSSLLASRLWRALQERRVRPALPLSRAARVRLTLRLPPAARVRRALPALWAGRVCRALPSLRAALVRLVLRAGRVRLQLLSHLAVRAGRTRLVRRGPLVFRTRSVLLGLLAW